MRLCDENTLSFFSLAPHPLNPQREEVLSQMNTDGEAEAYRGRHRLWLWGRIIPVSSPSNLS